MRSIFWHFLGLLRHFLLYLIKTITWQERQVRISTEGQWAIYNRKKVCNLKSFGDINLANIALTYRACLVGYLDVPRGGDVEFWSSHSILAQHTRRLRVGRCEKRRSSNTPYFFHTIVGLHASGIRVPGLAAKIVAPHAPALGAFLQWLCSPRH
jgi:hypothetical protein